MTDKNHLLYSLSPSGECLVIFRNGHLQIRNPETGNLQSTLPCPHDPPRQVMCLSDTHVGVRSDQKLVVYDIVRGVVAYDIIAETNKRFVNVAAAVLHECLYLVTVHERKVVLLEYHLESGTLRRKIKAGKTDGSCSMAVDSDCLVVATDSHIRILDKSKGSKLHKLSGSSQCRVAKGGLGCTLLQNTVQFFSVSSGKSYQLSTSIACETIVHLVPASDNGRTFWLLTDSKLWNIQLRDNHAIQAEILKEIPSNKPFCYSIVGNKLLVLRSTDHKIKLLGLDEPVSFDETTASGTEPAAKKQKTQVLGPGQAGTETAVSELKQREEEKEQENLPTIAERLQELQATLMEEEDEDDNGNNGDDSSNFVPKQATTESLVLLLQQALQANDGKLIETALQVRDAKVLQETCENLDGQSLNKLLEILTNKLITKPGRADHLSLWIVHVLKCCNPDTGTLQNLNNVVQERIEVFPLLLKLEGRLDQLLS